MDYDIGDAAASRQAAAEMAAELDALLRQGRDSILALASALATARRQPGS